MDLILSVAKTGMEAHHKSIEAISNNLANANTTAFKSNRVEFEDLPYQDIVQPGAPQAQNINAPGSIQMGTGVKVANNRKIFSEGALVVTNKDLDVAIHGRGFLQVQMPNGSDVAYTRAGALSINEQGQITLPNGYVVQPPITVPEGSQKISIGEDGTVSVIGNGTTGQEQIGQLQLYDFVNSDGLLPVGQNLYTETTASGAATQGIATQNGLGSIKQGTLEGSNVNVVEQMVNLIESQRAFEITSKVVSAVDNMLQKLQQIS
jgi:flagellar basal-body rod protein FlgG